MLGDRIGPRKVLTRIVLSAFTALTGAVSSYPLLLAVRFLFGAGEAGSFPNSATVVGRWIPLWSTADCEPKFAVDMARSAANDQVLNLVGAQGREHVP